jgi:hypothetical protein
MRRTIGYLRADLENGEGFVEWRRLLDEYTPITRADILKDIKGEIDAAYEQALKDMRPKHLQETEH